MSVPIAPPVTREEAIRVEREAREIVQRMHMAEYERTRAGAAEHALILVIIGSGIAAGILVLDEDILSALSSAGSVIKGFVY